MTRLLIKLLKQFHATTYPADVPGRVASHDLSDLGGRLYEQNVLDAAGVDERVDDDRVGPVQLQHVQHRRVARHRFLSRVQHNDA